jgi:DNA-binding NtrC family response regulator
MSTEVATGEYIEALGGTLARLDRPASPPIEIPGDPFIVGRDPECGLAVDSGRVSWIHAEVTATPKGVRVRDLDSKNGTFLEGHRIVEVCLSKPARICFGDVVFQFTPGSPVHVEAPTAEAFGPIVGAAPPMKRLFHRLGKVAATERTTLIMGESGTGKELIARAIHDAGPRARRPYKVIDCASLPASVAESSLFGHEKGSFTGATYARVSPFVEAEGGTVFLDEIGDLPIELQPLLLRLLQEQEITPVGSNRARKVNVRIIAGTHRELQRASNTSSFRSDLYFRLAVLPIQVPALRERREDIPMLLAHFARQMDAPGFERRISAQSFNRLLRHDWPGNVRELQNLVAVAISLADPEGEVRIEEHISSSTSELTSVRAPHLYKHDVAEAEFEKAYWAGLWSSCGGNISKISRQSGMGREAVRSHLAKYDLRSTSED